MVARVSSAFSRGGHAASFPEIIRVSYGQTNSMRQEYGFRHMAGCLLRQIGLWCTKQSLINPNVYLAFSYNRCSRFVLGPPYPPSLLQC